PFTNGFGMPSPFSPVFEQARDGFGVVNADLQYETTKLTIKNTSFLETAGVEHELRYGVEYIERDRQNASAAPGGIDERYAAFIIDVIDFGNGLTITPALRYETSTLEGNYRSWANDATLNEFVEGEFDDSAWMGGLSVRYEFETGFALFGSYSQTSSLPILDDLPSPEAPTEAPPTGAQLENRNRIFLAEEAETFEVGASYERVGLFTDSDFLALKVNYYDTTLEDMTSYAGIESVETQGLEIEGSLAFESGLYFDMNANFTDGDETPYAFTGDPTTDWRGVAQDTVRVTAGKRFGEQFDLSAEVLAADSTDITNLSQATNPDAGDSYTLLNLRATIRPEAQFLTGTSFRIGIENATDETYLPNLSTRFQPGRNVKLTITRDF
ncbi:MAG: TonB-dependent receptor, partial [Pseudomonadota bacterium]